MEHYRSGVGSPEPPESGGAGSAGAGAEDAAKSLALYLALLEISRCSSSRNKYLDIC